MYLLLAWNKAWGQVATEGPSLLSRSSPVVQCDLWDPRILLG